MRNPAISCRPLSRHALVFCALTLAGCQFLKPVAGPTVSAGATGAGQLTVQGTAKVLWIMPAKLTYTGAATYLWPNGETYTGDWLNGKRHGQGQQTNPNGWQYSGAWHNDQPHGQGELIAQNGERYLGQLHRGQRHGEGQSVQANGTYQGQWQNDLPHGTGSFVGNQADSYQGQYAAGQRSGEGTSVASDGSRYTGDWLLNKPHGQGQLAQATGATYQGGWVDGLRSGYGEYRDPLGTQYQGTWQAGKYHGYGKLQRADASRYEGDWQQGLRHGSGTEFFAEGGEHNGEWVSNRALGPGTRTTRNKVQISGVFTGDRVSNGLLQLPGNLEYAGPLFRRQMTQVAPALLEWVTTHAQQGNAVAQLLLGSFYQQFEQPQPNIEESIRWYRAAARTLPDAQYRLGDYLLKTEPKVALPLLQAAAAAEHRSAQFRLAELYRVGEAVSPNAATASQWYETATKQQHPQARINWSWLLATSQEAHARDPKKALQLIQPVAQLQPSWQVFDTLAAAYAATAKFDEAVVAQRKALNLLAENVDEIAASEQQHQDLTKRLLLYQSNEPYIELLSTAE